MMIMILNFDDFSNIRQVFNKNYEVTKVRSGRYMYLKLKVLSAYDS